MKIIPFLLFSIIFLIPAVSANLNISVVSENNKSINYYNLDNGSISPSYINGQYVDMAYQNYEVRMIAVNPTSFDSMWGFMDGLYARWVYLAIMVFIIAFIFAFAKVMR